MKRIPTLDGWRAIAILAVIASHAGRYYGHPFPLDRGSMGVDIFFALSGMLITSQLLQESDLRSFYIRRAFRILPPALLYLVVIYFLHVTTADDLLRCVFVVRNYVHGPVCTEHYWSLSLEEQFYLAWPLTLAILGKRARWAAFVAVVAVCVWRGLASQEGVAMIHRTDMRCDGLLWGCLSAFAFRAGNVKLGRIVPALAILAAIASWGTFALMPIVPVLLSIAVLGTAQEPGSLLSRALEWKPLVWIGQRSYGIYIWQSFFMAFAVQLPLRLVAIFIWPALLYRFYEMPLRNMGRRLAARRVPKSQNLTFAASRG